MVDRSDEVDFQKELTWQDPTYSYPENFAAPLKIAVEASSS